MAKGDRPEMLSPEYTIPRLTPPVEPMATAYCVTCRCPIAYYPSQGYPGLCDYCRRERSERNC